LKTELDKATGIKTSDTTTENAIEWILCSAFDRTDGLPQKTIAVHRSDELANKVATLAASGYKIVSLPDSEEETIDAVVTDGEIDIEACKDANIIWSEKATLKLESDKAVIIEGKDIVSEAIRIRQSDV